MVPHVDLFPYQRRRSGLCDLFKFQQRKDITKAIPSYCSSHFEHVCFSFFCVNLNVTVPVYSFVCAAITMMLSQLGGWATLLWQSKSICYYFNLSNEKNLIFITTSCIQFKFKIKVKLSGCEIDSITSENYGENFSPSFTQMSVSIRSQNKTLQ